MSEEALGVGWRQLSEFAGVDLGQSFILSWHLQGDALRIDVDLCLETEHPFYEAPLPAESVCIRPAEIEFPYCNRVGLTAQRGENPLKSLEKSASAQLRTCAFRRTAVTSCVANLVPC